MATRTVKEMRFSNNTRLLSQITGAFLILVGFGFLVLLTALKRDGELAGELKISAFMAVFGAGLVWVGIKFMRSEPEESEAEQRNSLDWFWLKLRGFGELCAAVGCVLMLSRVIAVFNRVVWPPNPLFVCLLVGPVAIGLFARRILVPRAFESGLFARDVVETCSTTARHLVKVLVRVGWFGYFGVPLASPEMQTYIPAQWRELTQIVACSFISILYASQVVMLHFGSTKGPERGRNSEGTLSHNGETH